MNGPTQILDLGHGFLQPMSAQQGSPRVMPTSVPGAMGTATAQSTGEVFSDALALAQGTELPTLDQQAVLTDVIPDAPGNILAATQSPTDDIAAITILLDAVPQTQTLSQLVLPEGTLCKGIDRSKQDVLANATKVEMMLASAHQTLGASLPVTQVTVTLDSVDVSNDLAKAAPMGVAEIDTILATALQLMPQPSEQSIAAAAVTELTTAKPIPPYFEMTPYPASKVIPIAQDGKPNVELSLPTPLEFKGLPQHNSSSLSNLGPNADAVSVELKPVCLPDVLQAPKPQSTFDTATRPIVQVAAAPSEIAQQTAITASTAAPEPTTIVPAMTTIPLQTTARKADPTRLPTGTVPTEGIIIDDATGSPPKTTSDQSVIPRTTARLPGAMHHNTATPLPPETRPSSEASVMTSAPATTGATGTPTSNAAPAQAPMQQSAMAGAMLDVRHQGWTKTLVNRAAQSVQAGGTLTLSILPQHLGQITLKLSEGRKGMELRITAEVASTASMLRGVETQISGAFDEAGLKLASFSANTGGQGQGGDTPNERRDTNGLATSTNTVDEAPQITADTSSLISIIA